MGEAMDVYRILITNPHGYENGCLEDRLGDNIKKNLTELELVQCNAQWWDFVLAVLNLRDLPSESE
jgi:hypothetical protein